MKNKSYIMHIFIIICILLVGIIRILNMSNLYMYIVFAVMIASTAFYYHFKKKKED
ncbi:hypothetical protein [Konateibacter massiliensis]|uniref:hypothetical protein n=1 Tax=Konateibacter massiliensis TaxID=2002841 RepID=UPI0015D503E0|nr:hypothetical protein [Konateibacter massiliensis]